MVVTTFRETFLYEIIILIGSSIIPSNSKSIKLVWFPEF